MANKPRQSVDKWITGADIGVGNNPQQMGIKPSSQPDFEPEEQDPVTEAPDPEDREELETAIAEADDEADDE